MKRVALGIATISALTALASGPVFAASATLESTVALAKESIDGQQYKKAELSLKKALSQVTPDGTNDSTIASAQVLLANCYRQAGKYSDSADALDQAHTIYKRLGFAEPQYVDELGNLSKTFKLIDLTVLGSAANTLKNNSSVISIAKTDSGAHIEIRTPTAFENPLNNPKVDGVQIDKLVSFDIDQQSGSIHLGNIKGFKIHSVEKNTWANLYDLKTNSNPDAEGKYDTQITAGKAGIQKIVAAKLPIKAYEPVGAMANEVANFGKSNPTMDLPIMAAKPKQAPAAEAAATSTPRQDSEPTTNTSAVSKPDIPTATSTTSTIQSTESSETTTSAPPRVQTARPSNTAVIETAPTTPSAQTSVTDRPITITPKENASQAASASSFKDAAVKNGATVVEIELNHTGATDTQSTKADSPTDKSALESSSEPKADRHDEEKRDARDRDRDEDKAPVKTSTKSKSSHNHDDDDDNDDDDDDDDKKQSNNHHHHHDRHRDSDDDDND